MEVLEKEALRLAATRPAKALPLQRHCTLQRAATESALPRAHETRRNKGEERRRKNTVEDKVSERDSERTIDVSWLR